jgi:hypothetical protein
VLSCLVACNAPEEHPSYVENLGSPVSLSGAASSGSQLIVSVAGEENKTVHVSAGSKAASVMPVTLCNSGGDLTVASLRISITAIDGGRLVTKEGTPVFSNVTAVEDGETRLGPGSYGPNALYEDPSTMLPTVSVGLPGPLSIKPGQCLDTEFRLDVVAGADSGVIGHKYSFAVCSVCAGKAGVDLIETHPVVISVGR